AYRVILLDFLIIFFFLVIPPPPTSTLFPYTTLFRSLGSPLPGFPSARKCGLHFAVERPRPSRGSRILSQMKRRAEIKSGYLLTRSEEHTSELQSPYDLVCRLLLEKKKKKHIPSIIQE